MTTTTAHPVMVGAVLYDPKVSVIWDIIRDFFEARGCPMDVVALRRLRAAGRRAARAARSTSPGTRRSPGSTRSAARAGRCRAIAMRDTDRDRQSFVVVPAASADQDRRGPARQDDRRRRARLAAGDADPVGAAAARRPRARARRHRQAVRRPGRQARRSRRRRARRLPLPRARRGRCFDRARPGVEGLDQGRHRRSPRAGASSPPPIGSITASSPSASDFEPERERRWLDALFSMSYDDPSHRKMMDMEGLRQWLPGRTSGFGPLSEAVERQGFFSTKGDPA